MNIEQPLRTMSKHLAIVCRLAGAAAFIVAATAAAPAAPADDLAACM
jgi:hypothetical protein